MFLRIHKSAKARATWGSPGVPSTLLAGLRSNRGILCRVEGMDEDLALGGFIEQHWDSPGKIEQAPFHAGDSVGRCIAIAPSIPESSSFPLPVQWPSHLSNRSTPPFLLRRSLSQRRLRSIAGAGGCSLRSHRSARHLHLPSPRLSPPRVEHRSKP